MKSFIDRLKLVFLALFAVSCAGVWTYQLMYARPQALCEGHRGWWDWRTRICAQPIPLYQLIEQGKRMEALQMKPGQKTPKGAPLSKEAMAPAIKP